MSERPAPFRVAVDRAGGGAAQAARFASGQPSWLVRAAAWAVLVAIAVVAVVVLVPVILIALAAFLVLALFGWARARLAGARAPNGPLDGRRNVRVITRGSAPPPVDSGG